MSEFAEEVADRVRQARASLAEAEATGDDYLVGVRTGELESLARLAADHDLDVRHMDSDGGLPAQLARHEAPRDLSLPD